jgi:hypothetical protein
LPTHPVVDEKLALLSGHLRVGYLAVELVHGEAGVADAGHDRALLLPKGTAAKPHADEQEP